MSGARCGITLRLAGLAAGAAPWADDSRLDRKVTTTKTDRPLRECLAEWTRESSVSLGTAKDYEDRAITLRLRERPLRQVLESVASLYGDVWTREKRGGRWAYVLEASVARRKRQSELLSLHERVVREALLARAQRWAQHGPREESLRSALGTPLSTCTGAAAPWFPRCRRRCSTGSSRENRSVCG